MSTWSVTIAGVDRTSRVVKRSLRGQFSRGARGTLSMSIYDTLSDATAYRPDLELEAILTVDGTVRFGGFITAAADAPLGGMRSGTKTDITVTDYSICLDRVLISYTFTAGMTARDIATYVMTTYLTPLFGFTLSAPNPGPALTADYPVIDATATEIFQTITTLTGWVVRVIPTKVVQLFTPGDLAASYNLDSTTTRSPVPWRKTLNQYANQILLRFTAAAAQAYGFLSMTSANYANGENVIVGGITYTFRTVLAASGDVLIGATGEDSQNNLVAAIMHTGGPGYFGATPANTQVEAVLFSASGGGAVVRARALAAGASGNSIVVHTTAVHALWYTEGTVPIATLALGRDEALTNTVLVQDAPAVALKGPWPRSFTAAGVTDTTLATALANGELRKALQQPRSLQAQTDAGFVLPGDKMTLSFPHRTVSGSWIVEDAAFSLVSPSKFWHEITFAEGLTLQTTWGESIKQLTSGGSGGSSISGIVVTGGGVGISGSGTTGTLTKWASAGVLGDSIITESGAAVAVAGTVTANTEMSVTHATSPSYYLVESGAGANLKNWRWNVASGVLTLQTVNDARSSVLLTAMSVVRATGALTIPAGLTAGSGAVGIIDSTGKIPALTSTYFASLAFAASNLTGQVTGANGGTGINTTGATGIPQLTASVWAISLTLQNAVQDNITRLGTISTAASFSSTLHVVGNFDVNTSKFTVAAASGNTLAAGTFDVTGDFKVNTNKFTVIASSGNTTVAGTFLSSGAATLSSTLAVTGDATFAANTGTASYVSQTTGWRVTAAGDADVRSLYTDALHAKAFIADLEQASAGGRLETKSVAVVASAFTVPAPGAPVSSITRSGGTATVTTSSAHGFSTGDSVAINGAVQTEYNGVYTIIVTDPTHYTYTVSGTPATPATGSLIAQGGANLVVEDLPGAPGMQVFAQGDTIVLRSFSRASGGLIIGDMVGGVSFVSSTPPTQTWYVSRNQSAGTTGSLPRGTVIAAKSLALDYGVSGNGYLESTTIDGTVTVTSITRASTTATVTTDYAHGYQTGDAVYVSGAVQTAYNGLQTITVTGTTTFTYTVAGSPATPATGTILLNLTNGSNAPYLQVVTWVSAPTAVNKTVRTRFGNARGITGTTEYGLFAGDFANKRYARLTNQNAELVGIPLLLYDGSTNTVKIDPTVPSIALGSTLPSAFGTGTGIWMGKDSSVYKFRVGNPSGNYMKWDGTDLLISSANFSLTSTGPVLAHGTTAVFGTPNAYAFTTSSGSIGVYGFTNAAIALPDNNLIWLYSETTAGHTATAAIVAKDVGDGTSASMTATANASGGSINVDGSLGITLQGPTTVTGTLSLPASSADIEIGSNAASNTPVIDFHSSNNAVDYNSRILAAGGNGTNGTGSLAIYSDDFSVVQSGGGVGLNIQSTGRVLIGYPSNSIAGDYALVVRNASSTGYGLSVRAANSTEYALDVQDYSQSRVLFRVYGDGGVVVGTPSAPAGGSKGAGTINVQTDIYKNNSAYTNPDYVFEHWATGAIVKYAANAGASTYAGLLPLAELERYVRAHYRFPMITDDPVGAFDRHDIALALTEQNTLYLFQLHARVAALEARQTPQ